MEEEGNLLFYWELRMSRNDVKYSILEKDGVEYICPAEHIPEAKDISFSQSGYIADNALDAIIESKTQAVETTGYAILGHSTGIVGWGRYLNIFGSISSDSLSFPITSNMVLIEAGIRSVSTSTISIGVYKLVNKVETLITTLSLSNEKSRNYEGLNINISQGQDLLFKVTSGLAHTPSCILLLRRE